ncbi:T9SS type A sorting domain-containing protein [Ferruginibacter sp. SUN002]|uniref:T9SS type A sorting domain-containing protein n=1 Tax=Ferruginibacter sp. SUN002 TaxID=2937789 RepID=UPI003D365040
MKQLVLKYFLFVGLFAFSFDNNVFGQNSVLVNIGSLDCARPDNPILSLIKNPLGPNPEAFSTCDMGPQLPSYYFVFVAYNPKDNKIYVNDTRNFVYSKVWQLDIGLPNDIICPGFIPTDPTYVLNYTINNFEFDNSGNLWAIRNYNSSTGQCTIEQFELSTGNVVSGKTLEFPTGHFPTDIGSGDLAILPNGRFFATLGQNPSQLYEINNYNGGTGNATATFLQTMPSNTFGIAYLNGQLEITGTNSLDSCYYFDYNISDNALGSKKAFQNEQAPIDNTSISPAVGVTKRLINVTKINSNTANLTYEIFVKNMGNVIIKNINVADDLAMVFGGANISNVSTSFYPGYNVTGLSLNSGYNGVSDINLLSTGQNLLNQTSASPNYLFKIKVDCQVTNLRTDIIYYNTAFASGSIGSTLSQTLINVTDSSNNGPAAVIDPNNNGNANELDENIPTPLDWNNILLPVNFIHVKANLKNNTTTVIEWQIATPVTNAKKFEIEYCTNGIDWKLLTEMNITDNNQENYRVEHPNVSADNLYYRIKEIDNNGYFVYSKIVMVKNTSTNNFTIYPNPASNYISIDKAYSSARNITAELINVVGQKILSKQITPSYYRLETTNIPDGMYLLKLINDNEVNTYKIQIKH